MTLDGVGQVDTHLDVEGSRARSRLAIATVAVLAIVSLGLRVWHLDTENPHVDELKQAREVQQPWSEIVELSYRHQQPPADYIIGKIVVSVLPANDFAQRLPAAIFGAAAICLTGLMLLRLGLVAGAVIAMLLAATNPLLVESSQYMRPYALPVFAVAATLAAYQRLRQRETRGRYVLFSLVAVFSVLTRALMPLLALLVLGLVEAWRSLVINRWNLERAIRSNRATWLVLPAVAVFVWAPSFLLLRRYGSGHLATGSFDLWGRLAISVERFGDFGEQALEPVSLLLALAAVAAIVTMPGARSDLARTRWLWAPLLLAAPAFAVAHSLTTQANQFFATRYMVFLPIGLAVYLAIGVSHLFRRRDDGQFASFGIATVVAVVTGVLILQLSATIDQLRTEEHADWQGAAERITAIEQPGDVIIGIDSRAFRNSSFAFGFEADDRYYTGDAPDYRPDDIMNERTPAAAEATRFHFVVFVPRSAPDAEAPPGWQVATLHDMTVLTTPELTSDIQRLEAWWLMSEWLRDDVAVMTRVGGYALELQLGRPGDTFPWVTAIRTTATGLNLLDVAEARLEAARESAG